MPSPITYQNIQTALQEKRLDSALTTLIQHCKTVSLPSTAIKEIRDLQNQLEALEKMEEVGSITVKDASARRARLTKRVVVFINKYRRSLFVDKSEDQKTTTRPTAPAQPKSSRPNRRPRFFERMRDSLDTLVGGVIRPRRTTASRPPAPRIFIPKEEPAAVPPSPPQAPAASAPASTAPSQSSDLNNPFQSGKILHHIPSAMPLNTLSTCRIRIAPETLRQEDIESGLTKEEKAAATTEVLRTSSVMKVELLNHPTNTDSFTISSQNNLEQPVFPFTYSEWLFDVQPKRPGHHAMLLRVTARVNIPGFGERSFDVAVYNRAIQVHAGEKPLTDEAFDKQPIPDPTWDEADNAVLTQALEQNNIAAAIERLANFLQDKDRELTDELLLLQARWNDNSHALNDGRIATADWDLMNSQIRYAITQIRDKVYTLATMETPEWTFPEEKAAIANL